jgi:hypothetical protein
VKKLKYRLLTAAVLAAALFYGCASVPLANEIMQFSITPETGIKGGTIVTVSVKAADDVVKVVGSVELMGSPEVELKYDAVNKIWYLRRMIPLGFVIPPGVYTAKIEAVTRSGDHLFEKKNITIR